MNWLPNGNFCTLFFSRSILAARNRHQISLLKDDDGQVHTNPQVVEKKIVKFYETLFTSKGLLNDEHKRIIRSSVMGRVPEEACVSLVVQPTLFEIMEAFRSMAVGKSLGPNGLSVKFYKHHWESVSKDVLDSFLFIFVTGDVPALVNVTTLSLVPKVDCPSNIKNYRPISYYNNIYKAITRILMRRMSGLIHELVSPCQSAFIPGRSMSDSVLLLQELVHGYHN
ncbi:hypothetical protein LIER_20979 [Lithospermum erythrorhizon]|uniref:Reverse transcriptase domain-containing protein n=1 Tax=Lithospermum erythrorhizon TaxID=34254 RepID=A0AAV3QRD4_LITER